MLFLDEISSKMASIVVITGVLCALGLLWSLYWFCSHFVSLSSPDEPEYFSPLGLHDIESYSHLMVYTLHDIVAVLSVVVFAYVYSTDKGNPWHVTMGRVFGLLFSVTTITGFLLIYMRQLPPIHLATPAVISRHTITTQGLSVLGCALNAFVVERYITKNILFSYLLLAFHIYGIILGVRSWRFLHQVFTCQYDNCAIPELAEICIEMLLLVTLPQLTFDIIFAAIHLVQNFKKYKGFIWKLNHEMSLIFLIYMSAPGLLFTVIHDHYWIFAKQIESIWVRMVPVMVLLVAFLTFNREGIVRNVTYHTGLTAAKEH